MSDTYGDCRKAQTPDVAAFFAATPGVSRRIINELRNTRGHKNRDPGVVLPFATVSRGVRHFLTILREKQLVIQ